METILDNIDGEEERRMRSHERRERMRREKALQAKRRRMARLYARIAARLSVLVVAVGLAGTVLWKGGKAFLAGKDEVRVEGGQAGENRIQAESDKLPEVEEDDTGALAAMGGQADISHIPIQEKGDSPEGQLFGAAGMVQTEGITREETPIYTFQSTEATMGIFDEEIISSHAILIDESMDTIIASKGEKERISPASMTKVLTILVAAEQITEEELEDTFTMTREITDYSYINDCSAAGFLDGEKVTVRDLFYGTILPSGADAALGLAVYVAGSQEAFVELMNQKLDELGLADSAHFTNCVGLYDEEHYCTVYDIAVMMKAAMKNELCRQILSAHTYITSSTTEHPEGITLSNWFLRRIEDKDTGGEVLGAKTGFVVQSQNCAVSYGTFTGGKPYICVTAGASSSWRCIYDHVEIYNRYIKA